MLQANSKTDHKLPRDYFLRVYTRCFCSEGGKFSKASEGFQELTQDLLLWRKQELSHQKKNPALKPTWTSNFRAALAVQKGLREPKIPFDRKLCFLGSSDTWCCGPSMAWGSALRGENTPFHCLLPSVFLPQSLQVSRSEMSRPGHL